MGHSLGSNLIFSTIQHLANNSKHKHVIETVHFFGSSITNDSLNSFEVRKIIKKVIHSRIINYYSPTDEVLKYAYENHQVKNPLGLLGFSGKSFSKFKQKKVHPKNHRFVSYAQTLNSFP